MAIKTKKRCNKCGELKIVTEFEEKGKKNSIMQYGPTCKACLEAKFNMPKENTKVVDLEHIEAEVESIVGKAGYRECRKCGKLKPIEEFYKDRVSNGIQKYRSECKKCSIEESKDRTKKYNEAKSNLVHDLTEQQWKECKVFFDNHCAYCGTGPVEEQEHIVSVKNGGGYTASNIIPSCKRCNASKGSRDMVKWYAESPWFSKERLTKIMDWVRLHL